MSNEHATNSDKKVYSLRREGFILEQHHDLDELRKVVKEVCKTDYRELEIVNEEDEVLYLFHSYVDRVVGEIDCKLGVCLTVEGVNDE